MKGYLNFNYYIGMTFKYIIEKIKNGILVHIVIYINIDFKCTDLLHSTFLKRIFKDRIIAIIKKLNSPLVPGKMNGKK